MDSSTLTPFFTPRGIAVVGASQDSTKLGYGLARNLVHSNYPGAVHFVNPRGGSLLGRPVYSNMAQVPEPVDLAFLLIPAAMVPQALHDCGGRGLKAAVIGSGGFRETGPEGAALEEECLQIAQSYGMRLIGPNCIGLLDTHMPMNATFLPPPGPPPGDVAYLSHSGAICAAVIDWARGHDFGLSRLVSLGNQADVNETDMLAPAAADPFTRVINLYLEGIRDGRRFVKEASRVSRQKPVIALKVGRYASGQRAVASHTGALAGQESAYNAAFRRAGVIRAETSEEMFDWARALAWCPPPKGRAIAVLTNAGGAGVTAADALESNGMNLAALQENTCQALREVLPAAASLHNPVDMLASASPDQYARCLQILLDDTGVHGVMVIVPPPPMFAAGAVAKALIPIINISEKPVVVTLMGERLIQEAVEHFRSEHVVEYRFPERAASALAVLAKRAEYLQRAEQAPVQVNIPGIEQARAILKRYLDAGQGGAGAGWLAQEDALHLLEIYGIAIPPSGLARTPQEAVEKAQQMGLPVALKVASADISHKSDVGGVLLSLHDPEEIMLGFEQVVGNARRARPQAEILGVDVQRMIPAGQEVIIGAVQDAQFGPMVMFGSGGIEVEGLKDVAFALAPMTEEEAEYLLRSTWAGRKLAGFRSFLPVDRAAVLQALLRLAQIAADFPQLAEIEINPLRVLQEGAFALDVRARLAG
ncbi:MAG: acetate--CoA ligase family protein [Anaerolineales bacterium]|nr:acetate--CoA ligase family protein [Anaerolineales bacterium]